MSIQNLTRLTAISIATMLAACGGGTGLSLSATAALAGSALGNTGSVTGAAAATADTHYVLTNPTSQYAGLASPFQQDASGAVTTLGGFAFTGAPTVTNEISGTTSYAMGRWSAGTVTNLGSVTKLSGADNNVFQYLVYNPLPSLPSTGNPSCDAGKFTAPSYVSGTAVTSFASDFGTATGSATLAYSSAGAAISMVIDATAGGSSAVGTFSGTNATTLSSAYTGSYMSNGQGAMLNLGDGGSGTTLIAAPYRIALANGAMYQGMAVFTCQ